ncbi:MAG: vWA domain-containing protein [Thermoanaerobaculia bacterium]
MHGGTTVNNMRTEFCSKQGLGLSTDHYPNNEQEDTWGQSCWERMAVYALSRYGITLTQPSIGNPPNTAMPAGHQDIGWIVVGDTLRTSLSLDRSYSMIGSKLDLTKTAADLFVDLVHEGEEEFLGVTSFSNTAVVNHPMTEVTDTAVKSVARAAISLIDVENMTALGDGLRASLNQITGNGTVPVDDSNIEAIILLSRRRLELRGESRQRGA